jgi:adenosylmethionine---8-amino-7-oxononanoate aminotransferase
MAFEGAYHGDTFGTMVVGARSIFSDVFQDLLFDVDFYPYPDTWDGDKDVLDRENTCLAAIEQKLSNADNGYAGIIIEPLVQGVAGMRMCRAEFLQQLSRITSPKRASLYPDGVVASPAVKSTRS